MLFQSQAREKILRGVNAVADAVRVTLGPKSKCVLIERKFGAPLVCNDGVTIAKETSLADPAENLGAQMIRQPPNAPVTPSGTALPRLRSWPRRSSPMGSRTWWPGPALWTSSAAAIAARGCEDHE